MAKQKKTRVTVDLSAADYEQLSDLREKLDVPSAAVIRIALKVYALLLQITEGGATVEVAPMSSSIAAQVILISSGGPLLLKASGKEQQSAKV